MKKIHLAVFALLLLSLFPSVKSFSQAGVYFGGSVINYGGPYNMMFNPYFQGGITGWQTFEVNPLYKPRLAGPFYSWEAPESQSVRVYDGSKLYQELSLDVKAGDTIKISTRCAIANPAAGRTMQIFVEGSGITAPDNTWSNYVNLVTLSNGGFKAFEYHYIAPANMARIRVGVAFNGAFGDTTTFGRVEKYFYCGVSRVGGTGGSGSGASSQWANNSATRISYGNQVAIGGAKFFNDNAYKLSVNGKMVAEELLIELNSTWPDYVFDPAYKKPTLREMEAFIQQHRHLPGIPSEKQVKEKGGVELGELNRKMLEKMEEMMLYLIDMDKKYRELEQKLKLLNNAKGR